MNNGVNGKGDSIARHMGEQAGAADFTFGEMQMRVALAAVRRWQIFFAIGWRIFFAIEPGQPAAGLEQHSERRN